MKKLKVGILGATGTVGQKFVLLLNQHPWFEIGALAASDRSAGKSYGETVSWKQTVPIPEAVAAMPVEACTPQLDCTLVFSGLDSSVAGEIEPAFARAGYWVFSNAKNFRMEPDVPLIIPEINSEHFRVLPSQRRRRSWSGAIVTNPNCSTIALALPLAPLHRFFGVESVVTVTLQALSGAGYPGVPGLDALANVIPHIAGEEEKIETETCKILGAWQEDEGFDPAGMTISAHTNRVPVEDGHLVCASVSLRDKPGVDEVAECLSSFAGPPQQLELPTAPRQPLILMAEPDRPQPKRDVLLQNGMPVLVGRLRPCPLLDFRFVALGHNTIRGAAGASVLNAELALKTRILDETTPDQLETITSGG